ncbi:MAG: RAD55 family ATPase [Thermoplasmata archaeon]|nr:RAD55 family ATPase [Thermoplasmata archaeon]MCI4355923.1 RAD55 family ATPase [Thermoplasmata archaeon]
MSTDQSVLGIPELDPELFPYMPPGWLGLLVGHSGAGTPLFAKQFAQAMVGASPVLYYTTYERTEDVHKAFRDFGWDPDGVQIVNLSEEYFRNVLVRSLEVSQRRERGLKVADLSTTNRPKPSAAATYNITSRLLADLAALDGRFRLVLDSLDFFFEVLENADVMTMVRQIRHRAQELGGQALLVVQGEFHERRVSGMLEDMADVVVELTARPRGEAYEHLLAVRKIRNHPERTRILPARMTETGLTVARPDPKATATRSG